MAHRTDRLFLVRQLRYLRISVRSSAALCSAIFVAAGRALLAQPTTPIETLVRLFCLRRAREKMDTRSGSLLTVNDEPRPRDRIFATGTSYTRSVKRYERPTHGW